MTRMLKIHTGAPRAAIALAGLMLAACSQPAPGGWSGYIEGDYVQVAAPLAGALTRLSVQAGDAVAGGAPLFTLDASNETAASAEAQARLDAARAQAANTELGRRPDELAVTRAQLDQAQALAQRTASDLLRQQELFAQGFIAATRVDEARSADDQARARVAELQSALKVARLPARRDEQAAARAQADAARQALAQARWREQQKTHAAPLAGTVADTYYRVGEWVVAGQPVLSLLPAGQVHARFYVPEPELAGLTLGQRVELRCDGCAAPVSARITHIASQAEYTPPVIYSNAQRAKLVFRVQARPDGAGAAHLHPGLPVDVHQIGGGP
jgi:HlyD family secretion protein